MQSHQLNFLSNLDFRLKLLQVDSFAVSRSREMHEATRRILSVILRQVNCTYMYSFYEHFFRLVEWNLNLFMAIPTRLPLEPGLGGFQIIIWNAIGKVLLRFNMYLSSTTPCHLNILYVWFPICTGKHSVDLYTEQMHTCWLVLFPVIYLKCWRLHFRFPYLWAPVVHNSKLSAVQRELGFFVAIFCKVFADHSSSFCSYAFPCVPDSRVKLGINFLFKVDLAIVVP